MQAAAALLTCLGNILHRCTPTRTGTAAVASMAPATSAGGSQWVCATWLRDKASLGCRHWGAQPHAGSGHGPAAPSSGTQPGGDEHSTHAAGSESPQPEHTALGYGDTAQTQQDPAASWGSCGTHTLGPTNEQGLEQLGCNRRNQNLQQNQELAPGIF